MSKMQLKETNECKNMDKNYLLMNADMQENFRDTLSWDKRSS